MRKADVIPASSVPIPKFVAFAEPRFELRNRKDISKPMILVWLWFRSPLDERAAQMTRTSKPPH
jgi:hypothetical protein